MRKKQATLTELIRRQTEHIAEGEKLAQASTFADDEQKRLGSLAGGQEATQTDTKTLVTAETAANRQAEELSGAESKMGTAVASLKKEKQAAADKELPPQRKVLELLKKELRHDAAEIARREAEVARSASPGWAKIRRAIGNWPNAFRNRFANWETAGPGPSAR